MRTWFLAATIAITLSSTTAYGRDLSEYALSYGPGYSRHIWQPTHGYPYFGNLQRRPRSRAPMRYGTHRAKVSVVADKPMQATSHNPNARAPFLTQLAVPAGQDVQL